MICIIEINVLNVLSIIILLSGFSYSANAGCNYKDFQGWKDCFIEDKLSHKLGSVDIEVFKQAEFIEKVIKLDHKHT
jgi:hypothetical protein